VAESPRSVLAGLRRQVAPAAKAMLFRTGACAALRHLAPSRRLGILRYHAICTEEGYAYAEPGICITPAAFERHAAYLAANYTVLPLPEAVDRLRGRRPLPPNAAVITFDDGYADNLAAAHVLARHGLPATFYITAGCVGGAEPFWPSELRVLVPAVPGDVLRLDVAGQPVEIPLATADERQSAIRAVTRLFKARPIPVRESMREQLRRLSGLGPVSSPMLTWDGLAEMARLGMTIGAHTMTHANLPSAGPDVAREEIAGSKARLEHALGVPVTMFSYPNGGAERYVTPELQRTVAESGFLSATTSRNGFAGAGSDLYALERIEVEERLEDLVFALEVERFAFKPGP
jgi:peptidoglycan/xylan/chitin deacetylase (PgdA/CDA1 family)